MENGSIADSFLYRRGKQTRRNGRLGRTLVNYKHVYH